MDLSPAEAKYLLSGQVEVAVLNAVSRALLRRLSLVAPQLNNRLPLVHLHLFRLSLHKNLMICTLSLAAEKCETYGISIFCVRQAKVHC